MAKSTPNIIDRAVAYFAPIAAIKRSQARSILSYYEAAKPDRLRKGRRETGSGNDAVLRAGATLRQTARHLEQNYDLALGVLNTLVANVVGPNGIGVEPQPRNLDGSINDELARQILELYRDWGLNPEVTRQHDWPSAQRLLARSWLRDGEVLTQTLQGNIAGLDHATRVPFSLEMLEADFVPMDLNTTAPAVIVQGVQINAWGAPVGYHVYKADPLAGNSMLTGLSQTKFVPAARMLHLKNVHRIRQMRGVSVFASVLNRFDDLKDYEESERIAAKIAASMAAFIKKGSPDLYDPEAGGEPRNMKFRPGMVFDDLRPGEEIGMIDTNRPNPNLETYRSGQLKAVAAGAGPTFSSIARSYDGTYSAQRQELVEGYTVYSTLANEFIGRIVRPVYEQFIAAAVASGALRVPAGTRMVTLNDAAYMPPAMPWIDPKKEAEAWGMLEDRCYVSGPEIIRRRGGNPIDTLEQQSRWVREKDAQGIPANAAMPAAAAAPMDAEASGRMAGEVAALVTTQVTAQLRPHAAPVPAVPSALEMAQVDLVKAQAQAALRDPVAPVNNFVVNTPATTVNNTIEPAAVTVQNTVEPTPVHMHTTVEAAQVSVAAPVVTVQNTVQPAELNVLSLPKRKTETAVEYDANDNIVKTTQIESDVTE